MRPADQIKETRSYIVIRTKIDTFEIEGSHWAPGYTPAHCATKEEAMDYAIKQKEEEALKLNADLTELYDLKAFLFAEDN